jgi:NADH-quinone oxidoreductase subunit G
MADPVTLSIDGQSVEAQPSELVIAAAERAGVYIPRFCYHPRMRPVGMCRMCLVNVDTGRGPALQPACMIECTPNMVVDTQAPAVKKAQDGVLEFLLINHPLDCPVCDKGGECPLQDQTLHFGPGETRFVEEKRHFEKPIAISGLVTLDRERCILCDRCTRFSKEVAGDPLIHFLDRGNETQVNVFPDHPFASYFSGNTVQICPVGALTATPYRFKARPWDIEQVNSTCTSCAVGCRVAVQSSSNALTRYLGLDSDPVNHSWLCDRGRFDFEAVNSDNRLIAPWIRKSGELVEASWGEALSAAGGAIAEVIAKHGAGAVAVLGGARLANEDAYAWAKLAKGVIGTDSVDAQIGDGLPAELVVGLPQATIDEVCAASALIVLAPDIKEELPVLFLRLREAIVDHGLSVIELTPRSTSLTPLAADTLYYRPGEAAAVVAALLAEADATVEAGGVPAAVINRARAALVHARSGRGDRQSDGDGGGEVAVLLGRPSLGESGQSIADAAAELCRALPDARFLVALRRGNVRGALDLGLAPGLLPGRVTLDEGRDWYSQQWGKVPKARGLDAAGMLTAAAEGRIHALVLLGADPLSDFPDRELARRALSSVSVLVAVDTFLTDSSSQATVVLPAAAYGERPGTTTNLEGRITGLGQKVVARGTTWADWMIAVELADALGGDLGMGSLDDIWDEIERVSPVHVGLTRALITAPGRADGNLVPLVDDPAAGALTLAEVVARDPSAAYSPVTVVDGTSGSVGLRIKGGMLATPVTLSRRGTAGPDGSGRDLVALDATISAEVSIGADAAPETLGAAPVADAVPAADSAADGGGAGETDAGDDPGLVTPARPSRPSPSVWVPPARGSDPPALDAYSLRLVATRKLYDMAVSVRNSPSLVGLVANVGVGVNPVDLERLGVTTGQRVRVISTRSTLSLEAIADPGVPHGSAAVVFNLAGLGAGDLIDVSLGVTDVRVETT